MSDDVERVCAGLTEAQRRAITLAKWREADGPWWPEGVYCYADKRVRYNLCCADLLADYLNPWNRLTPLGLACRALIAGQEGE